MRLKYLNKATFIVLLTVALVSCKKQDLTPINSYTEDNFWQINDNVYTALATCYQQQISGGQAGSSSAAQAYFYNEALSDNAYCPLDVNVGTPTAIASGSSSDFNAGINRVKYEWGSYYTNIRSCNLFLENVDKNTTLDATTKARLKAEARYIRAHAYFRLTNFFGGVPLVKKVLTPEEAKTVTRATKADVVAFILTELDAAATDLPTRDLQATADRGRITKGAAKAMKARVLLYNERWAECATVCEELMAGQYGTYALVTTAGSAQSAFENIFSANNKYNSEVISDLGYALPNRTWGDFGDFAPFYTGEGGTAANNSNNVPTQDLVESYLMTNGKLPLEPGSGYQEDTDPYSNRDPRLAGTIVYHGYQWKNNLGNTATIYIKPGTAPDASNKKNEAPASKSGYFWRKYYDPFAQPGGFSSGENIIIQRWAEVLLMYAEAKTMLGQMDATVWDATIRPLRTRAGFPPTSPALTFPGNTTMSMIDQVRNERRCELAFESLRYDDIKRWKIAEVVLNRPTNNQVRGAKYAAGNTTFLRLGVRQFDPAKHYLWPIPTETRQTAPGVTQNPGWN